MPDIAVPYARGSRNNERRSPPGRPGGLLRRPRPRRPTPPDSPDEPARGARKMRIQRHAGGELCALASTSPGNNYPHPLLLELWLIFETVGGPTRLRRRALNEWQDLGL